MEEIKQIGKDVLWKDKMFATIFSEFDSAEFRH